MSALQRYKKHLPLAAIFMCCLIWGTTFTIVKDASESIDAYLLSGLRNVIAVIVLFVYILAKRKTDILLDKQSMLSGAVLGVLLGTIYISQTFGIAFTTANHSAFITCSAVIMVPIILFLFGWQKFTIKQIISIVCVAVGLILLTLKSEFSSFNVGDLITFAAAIICAFHIVASGHYVRKLNFLSLIFYQFIFAALISFIGLFVQQGLISDLPVLFTNEAIFNVLYLGLLGTLFCYFVTVWGQKHVSTVYIALIFSLEPLFASITNYFVLGETFTSKEFLGAIVIFIGIVLYSIPWRKYFRSRAK